MIPTKLNNTDMPSHDEQPENHSPLDPVKGCMFGMIAGLIIWAIIIICIA
jgi:hypothetical protein